MKNIILPSLRALLILTILTGIVYPFLMTVLAQLLFPHQANGSLIVKDGNVVGSELIGQNFRGEKYFWPRPSAIDYNPMPSGASNAGPTSIALRDSVNKRKNRFILQNALSQDVEVPNEMLFASGSGVDPHISPEAALLQVNRVAKARGLDRARTIALKSLVLQLSESPQLMVFGQPRVNVLKLNLELDRHF